MDYIEVPEISIFTVTLCLADGPIISFFKQNLTTLLCQENMLRSVPLHNLLLTIYLHLILKL